MATIFICNFDTAQSIGPFTSEEDARLYITNNNLKNIKVFAVNEPNINIQDINMPDICQQFQGVCALPPGKVPNVTCEFA